MKREAKERTDREERFAEEERERERERVCSQQKRNESFEMVFR